MTVVSPTVCTFYKLNTEPSEGINARLPSDGLGTEKQPFQQLTPALPLRLLPRRDRCDHSYCMRNTLETLKISFSFSFYRQNIAFTIEFLKLLNLHVFGGIYTQESWQNIVFTIEFLKLLNLHVFGRGGGGFAHKKVGKTLSLPLSF